ncbi:MAG TPA: hypothetical protein VEB21_14830 [Terriglobales bacterium]|nr:hypothetical protein [Terriglobales bacterium]
MKVIDPLADDDCCGFPNAPVVAITSFEELEPISERVLRAARANNYDTRIIALSYGGALPLALLTIWLRRRGPGSRRH